MKTQKAWNRFTKQKISEIWTPICQPLGIGTTTFGSLPPSGMESNFLMCDKAMLYCGIQYMSRSCSWTLIQKHSPSDFEVLRTQINPISRIDISHKSCADLVLPLHENHVDFLSAKQSLSADIEFQSSLPVRGATRQQSKEVPMDEFQSTLPGRGATLLSQFVSLFPQISIHAPREGSDCCGNTSSPGPSNFNPRSPWGERPGGVLLRLIPTIFQSTLPVRGATPAPSGRCWSPAYFNPRSP